MAPSAKSRKEKIYHPESRKAEQLVRKAHRKQKLGNIATNRSKKNNALADFYAFFYNELPVNGILTLEQLHNVLKNWLGRHDQQLEQEKAQRRKGRPKSAKEVKLEELKLRESEEYRTGFEVIDLTHEPTVELFRQWDQNEVAFIQLLRFVRISSSQPGVVLLSKPGKHTSILNPIQKDIEMAELVDPPSKASLLAEPPSRFSSTMMTMDDPL